MFLHKYNYKKIGLVILLIYSIVWGIGRLGLQQILEQHLNYMRKQGYQVSYTTISACWFPNIGMRIKDLVISRPKLYTLEFKGATKVGISPWRLWAVEVDTPHGFLLQLHGINKQPIIIKTQSSHFSLPIFDMTTVNSSLQKVKIYSYEHLVGDISRVGLEVAWGRREDATAVTKIKWAGHDIGLSSTQPITLAALSGEMEAQGIFRGLTLQEKIQTWFDSNGTLDIKNIRIEQGNDQITMEGSLSVDEKLQPMAAVSCAAEDGKGIVRLLHSMQLINKNTEHAALFALPMFISNNRLSLSLQDRKLHLGKVRLLKVPAIEWDNSMEEHVVEPTP